MNRITAVIALYNKEKYIDRAIRSIQSQTKQVNEIVVVDDGSTDAGPDIVKSIYDSRIKLIYQDNQGVSLARNNAVSVASNNIIAFLDADDEWLPNHIEEILLLVKQFPSAGAYGTSYRFEFADGRSEVPKFRNTPRHPWRGAIQNIYRSSLGDCPFWTSAVAVRREVMLKIGGFSAGESIAEDLDLWFKIASSYSVAWSTEITAVYHRDITGSAMNTFCLKKDPLLLQTLETILVRCDKLNKDILNLIAKYYYDFAVMYINNNDKYNSERCFKSMMKYARGSYYWELLARYCAHNMPLPIHKLIREIRRSYTKVRYRSSC